MNTLQTVQDHFEFLGYEVSQPEGAQPGQQVVLARRADRYSLIAQVFGDAIVVESFFNAADTAADRGAYLAAVNELNRGLALAKGYVEQDGTFGLRAFYPGDYERARFARFLEIFDGDCAHFSQQESFTAFLK